MNSVGRRTLGWIIQRKVKEFQDSIAGKEHWLHIVGIIALSLVVVVVIGALIASFATVSSLSFLFFIAALIFPALLLLGLFVPSFLSFRKSTLSAIWTIHAVLLGVFSSILPYLCELLGLVIVAVILLIAHPSYGWTNAFYGPMYGVTTYHGWWDNNGTMVTSARMNGYDLAFSSTVMAFTSAFWEEVVKCLVVSFFVYIVIGTLPYRMARFTDIWFGALVGAAQGCFIGLWWLYLYETYYNNTCTYCPYPTGEPVHDSTIWGINVSTLFTRSLLAVVLHTLNGICIGIWMSKAKEYRHWGYVITGLGGAFMAHFFFDLLVFGFAQRLIFGLWWETLLFLMLLALVVVVQALAIGICVLRYVKGAPGPVAGGAGSGVPGAEVGNPATEASSLTGGHHPMVTGGVEADVSAAFSDDVM